MAAAAVAAVPELVSSGALTPGQGAVVVEMIRAEDPVVFAACRVAGAAESDRLPATAAAAAAATAGGASSNRGVSGSRKGRGGSGGGGRGGGGGGGGEWGRCAQTSFASMVKVMLAAPGRGGVVDRENGYSNVGVGDEAIMGVWEGEKGATTAPVGTAGEYLGGGGGGRLGGGKEPPRGRRPRDLRNGGFRGEAGGGDEGIGTDGQGKGVGRSNDLSGVPPSFQADVIALADISLVTGKVSRRDTASRTRVFFVFAC